jgi:spastin
MPAAEGYSGSDLAALCKEAAMAAIRELGPAIATASADAVRRSPVRQLALPAARCLLLVPLYFQRASISYCHVKVYPGYLRAFLPANLKTFLKT